MLAFFEGDGDEGLQAFVEPFVIMLILVINAVVGVWQEHNAENALDALKEMQTTTTKVLRNGVLVPDVPSSELMPGDVVDVRVGDKVPADVRIIKLKTTTIKTDEGSLTGESETVLKQLELVEKDVRIQGKLNMMFSGTTISNGAAIGVVTATGMRTEIGKIQANVTEAKEDEEKTPLGQKARARPTPPPAHPPSRGALFVCRCCAASVDSRGRLWRRRVAPGACAPPPPLRAASAPCSHRPRLAPADRRLRRAARARHRGHLRAGVDHEHQPVLRPGARRLLEGHDLLPQDRRRARRRRHP